MPELISRKDAKAAGLKRYFTGVPCKRGHFDERRTSNGSCVECVSPRFHERCEANREAKANLEAARARGDSYFVGAPCRRAGHTRRYVSGSHACVECAVGQTAEQLENLHARQADYCANREAAQMRGDRYFAGAPCSRAGHTNRYVKDNSCADCRLGDYEANREAKLEYNRKRYESPKVKAATAEYMRDWYERNRAHVAGRNFEWRKANYSYAVERDLAYNRKRRGVPIPSHPSPGLCECCGKPPSGRLTHLVPDHCHITGMPRGWLCDTCNLALGALGDDIAGVEQMIAYLLKYSQFAWWEDGGSEPEIPQPIKHNSRGTPLPAHPLPTTCECCGGTPNGPHKQCVPDHCHLTGMPRGWLCSVCNVTLGKLGDDLLGVMPLRRYLFKYSQFAYLYEDTA